MQRISQEDLQTLESHDGIPPHQRPPTHYAFLGHKKSDNTLLYVQLDKKLFKDMDDSFITRIAHNAQEACGLVEVGFGYVTGEYSDGGKIFKKRK